MGKILCATRGGEDSYRAQDKAIALAKERGDELVFLYVVDLAFLDKTAGPIVVDVKGGMDRMGEFLLIMAQERAREQGVTATYILREGEVQAEIKAATREEGIDLVVLGQPGGENRILVLEALRAFADEIKAETGAEVLIV